jgi:hypothetical protein
MKYLVVMFLSFLASHALAAMEYIHNGPESPRDKRYDFHWELLHEALERTRPTHGPYKIKPAINMSEQRQKMELIKARGKISIMFLGTSDELERTLIPVRIPVDRGLSGYFVFLINKEIQKSLEKVKTTEELKRFKVGLANDWLDVKVYQHNGFQVVLGTNYDGLFAMVERKRFDLFPRSAVEILPEWKTRRSSMPHLAIEKYLLVHYPWPMYFWFSKTLQGEKLAERAQKGLEKMLEDGSYERLFHKYFQAGIDELKLTERNLLELENPLLPASTPLKDKRLWFKLNE